VVIENLHAGKRSLGRWEGLTERDEAWGVRFTVVRKLHEARHRWHLRRAELVLADLGVYARIDRLRERPEM
jgi:hypothetical protein